MYEKIKGHDAHKLAPNVAVGGALLVNDTVLVRRLQKAAHDANVQYP